MAKTLYDFPSPSNLDAIRCTIMQRIQQQKKKTSQLDNGLPSPPVESCPYDAPLPAKEQPQPTPHVPVVESLPPKSITMSEDAIKEKIRVLKDEKQRLSVAMNSLLSQQQKQHNTTKPPSPPAEPITTVSTPFEQPKSAEPKAILQPLSQRREDYSDTSSSASSKSSSTHSIPNRTSRSQSVSYTDRRKMPRHDYRRPPTCYDDRYYGSRYSYPAPPSPFPSYAPTRRMPPSPYLPPRHSSYPRHSSFRPRLLADRHLPRY